MTLILSWARPDAHGLVCDQRITLPDGSVCDDQAIKVVSFSHFPVRMTLAFTGLAFLGTPLMRTDVYLVEKLRERLPSSDSLSTLLEAVAQDLTKGIRDVEPMFGIGKPAPLTVVGVGFHDSRSFSG